LGGGAGVIYFFGGTLACNDILNAVPCQGSYC